MVTTMQEIFDCLSTTMRQKQFNIDKKQTSIAQSRVSAILERPQSEHDYMQTDVFFNDWLNKMQYSTTF